MDKHGIQFRTISQQLYFRIWVDLTHPKQYIHLDILISLHLHRQATELRVEVGNHNKRQQLPKRCQPLPGGIFNSTSPYGAHCWNRGFNKDFPGCAEKAEFSLLWPTSRVKMRQHETTASSKSHETKSVWHLRRTLWWWRESLSKAKFAISNLIHWCRMSGNWNLTLTAAKQPS